MHVSWLLSVCALAACGVGAGAESETDQLTVVGWGGQVDEAFEKTINEPFAEEEGVTVVQDAPIDYAKIKAQVESGKVTWDVARPEAFWAIANCGTLLEPLDQSKIDSIDQLPENGVTECGIPVDTIAYLLMYDASKFGDDPPTSWADFFDLEKYPGNRGVWNYSAGGALEVALLADGVAKEDLYPLDLDRAFAKLDTIRDEIAFYDTGAVQTQQMESQDVAMTIAWSARGADAVEAGAPFEPVWQDHLRLYEDLVILKGSKNQDLAYKYLAHATSAESQSDFAALVPYGPANEEATPELEGVAADFYVNDPEIESQGYFMDQDWWSENLNGLSERWGQWATS